MNRTSLLIVLVALVAGVAGLMLGARVGRTPEPAASAGLGDPYVDLVLPDVDGKPRRLSEWDGRPRLVNFWATWCPPCIEEMPDLEAVHRTAAEHGVAVIGIAQDDPERVARFLRELVITYPVLLEPPGSDSSRIYGNTHGVLPYSVLIDRHGLVVARKLGAFRGDELRRWIARTQPGTSG